MDEEQLMECPACGHRVATRLGQLGNREHYRCRACGMDFSMEVQSAHPEGETEEAHGLDC
jgi:DNA-directed RNA polymerase subunit RPC12/RpoP